MNLNGEESSINFNDVENNSKSIQTILQEEIEINNNDSTKVFIGGFSQGCAMALHNGLTFNQQLGGIIALSGFAFSKTKINEETFANLKILICHGTSDMVVPLLVAEKTYNKKELLEKENVTWYKIPNLGHGANPSTLKYVAQYWKELNL